MNTFNHIIGQPQAMELLTGAIAKNRIAPAYLFMGTSGIGKSLTAKAFIQLLFTHHLSDPEQIKTTEKIFLNNNHPDLLWIEPTYLHQGKLLSSKEAAESGVKRKSPPQIRLEQIREISQFLSKPPLKSPRSVVVLEQAETMAEGAANGLLKTLEEPGKATLILLAPSPESLLPTLVSRCQRIPFYRLQEEAIIQILKNTEFEHLLNDQLILEIAQGSPGEAINIFQQLQKIPPELLESLKNRPKTTQSALELAKQIDKKLDTELQIWLVDYLQHWYWQKEQKLQVIKNLEKAKQCLLSYVQPRLVWEVTLLQLSVIS
ncbi:MAG TPA: DNA polymerase III subunit delta' [Allocoleopsis sp.]